MPMNVSATAVPTVVWKWPGTEVVLWITLFMVRLALMMPVAPPTMKVIIASNCAVTEKAVARLGKKIAKVITPCSPFTKAGTPGSVYWWWYPVGIEKSRNMMKTIRVSGSLISFPCTWRGTIMYQETYAGSSQK
jgi:hypothetical protein